MPLVKTTELSEVDVLHARATFHDLINNEPLVLFVVLGSDLQAKELVEKADKVAGGPLDLRRVVWMRNPTNHQAQIADLKSSQLLTPSTAAFCTNYDDEICDTIDPADFPITFTRILKAFAKGEIF
jgi:hypothetical protein